MVSQRFYCIVFFHSPLVQVKKNLFSFLPIYHSGMSGSKSMSLYNSRYAFFWQFSFHCIVVREDTGSDFSTFSGCLTHCVHVVLCIYTKATFSTLMIMEKNIHQL